MHAQVYLHTCWTPDAVLMVLVYLATCAMAPVFQCNTEGLQGMVQVTRVLAMLPGPGPQRVPNGKHAMQPPTALTLCAGTINHPAFAFLSCPRGSLGTCGSRGIS